MASILRGIFSLEASEIQVSTLDVKLIVPAVGTLVLLYLNSIVEQQALASLLLALVVTAVVLNAFFFAIKAAMILAFVLPEIDTKYTCRPLAMSGFKIICM